jgi:hypothetical protein
MRVIISTPHARTRSSMPAPTRPAASDVACCEEPHWLSTVVAATSIGKPCEIHAVRAMLKACSLTCDTQPPMICPISLGSTPARSTAALCTAPSRSAGWSPARPPLRRPMGERTASTMKTSCMSAGLLGRA